MDRNEQELIDELFGHLAEVERGSGPRDAEVERYISQLIARQPASPYFMAQSLIMQERALAAAQERIAELEQQVEDRGNAGRGSFLGGLFGGGAGASGPARTSVPSTGSVPRSGGGFSYPGQGAPADRGYGGTPDGGRDPQPQRAPAPERSGGGSFLGGVMQTAAGVAGGVVLGNMITGMLGGHSGHGAQTPASEPRAPAQEHHHDVADDRRRLDDDSTGSDFDGGFDDFGGGIDV